MNIRLQAPDEIAKDCNEVVWIRMQDNARIRIIFIMKKDGDMKYDEVG